jgi:HK97 family phage major capsid protein
MLDFLKDLLQRKNDEIDALMKRNAESEDVAELETIGKDLEALNVEKEELEAKINEAESKENETIVEEPEVDEAEEVSEERAAMPEGLELRNANVLASFGGNYMNTENNTNLEYRNAFMEFVLRGTAIPMELRESAQTTDVASVIPTVLVNNIIEKFDNVGMILPLITKTSYKAGVEVPTSSVKPVASWVAEGATSDKQKKTTGKIVFAYYKLRCEISMSMEVGTMALAAFEAKFVENVAKAMTYAIENAVINGTGSGQPKGILTETGVTLETAANKIAYADLCNMEGALPVEYETGAKYCMNKKTFAKVLGMTDEAGQPIARVNYGIGGAQERTILGREVVVSPYVADDKLFMYDFSDYILNTVYDMGISKKQDWDTEDLLTKAVMSVDGKSVDNGSLVVLSIKASA